MDNKILQVENLEKNYGKKDNLTEALKGISFNVFEGEFLGIMGASGSGKTTILNCIATMLKPSSGKIKLNNQDISKFNWKKSFTVSSLLIALLCLAYGFSLSFGQEDNSINKTCDFSIDCNEGEDDDIDVADILQKTDIKEMIYNYYPVYTSGIKGTKEPDLDKFNQAAKEINKDKSIINSIGNMKSTQKFNSLLNKNDCRYENYLKRTGRYLFYAVCGSYIAIYLGVIFILIANAVIGIKYLLSIEKNEKQYKTLFKQGTHIHYLADNKQRNKVLYQWISLNKNKCIKAK